MTALADWDGFMNFRREVAGSFPDGTACMTVIELAEDRTGLVVRLASKDVFTVCLAVAAVAELSTAVLNGETSYVSAEHAVYGRRLLGVHPHVVEGAQPLPDTADCGPASCTLSCLTARLAKSSSTPNRQPNWSAISTKAGN